MKAETLCLGVLPEKEQEEERSERGGGGREEGKEEEEEGGKRKRRRRDINLRENMAEWFPEAQVPFGGWRGEPVSVGTPSR